MTEIPKNPEEPSSDTETGCTAQKPLTTKWRKNGLPWEPTGKEAERMQNILAKVKLALQQNADKRQTGKRSNIIVFYHRGTKKKSENQPKNDEESM
nr:uncharacterized protein LOC111771561 [Equus caballus]